jgi:hypothetical protein
VGLIGAATALRLEHDIAVIFQSIIEKSIFEKKSRAQALLKIVSTLFPRKLGFDLD